jgi:hypothetical protein
MMSTPSTLAERRPSFSGMSASRPGSNNPLPGQGWRCQCLACPPFILLSPEKPSARGTSSGQAHGIYEEAREIRNGRRQKVFWGYGAHRSQPLLSSDAGHLLRLAASLLGHNLCFVTRNQIKLFVLLTKDLLVRIKSCRKGIEGVVRGKLIPRSLHCLQNFMPVHGLLLDHLSHH